MARPADSIEAVLREELAQVRASRLLRCNSAPNAAQFHDHLIALAFSGGGIRSATFNLGVLQALAEARLLRFFDYLSTVSGGGYIGSWLHAWMHHENKGVVQVEEDLSAPRTPSIHPADPPQVHFLRDYSNYLTPRRGLFSADLWAFVSSYSRNTLLNQAILLLALSALLLLPRAMLCFPQFLGRLAQDLLSASRWHGLLPAQQLSLVLGFLLAAIAVRFIGRNLAWVNPPPKLGFPRFTGQGEIQITVVLPLFFSAVLLIYGLNPLLQALWAADSELLQEMELDWLVGRRLPTVAFLGFVIYFSLWASSCLFAFLERRKEGGPVISGRVWRAILVTAAFAGALCGMLFSPLSWLLTRSPAGWPGGGWHILAFGAPLLILVMLLTGALHIGLIGRAQPDEVREWWARLGGLLLLSALGWVMLFLVAIYAPVAVGKLWYGYPRVGLPVSSSALLAWAASTLFGIQTGKGPHTGAPQPGDTTRKKLLNLLARLAPYVFILGLFAGLSVLIAWVQAGRAGSSLVLPPDDQVSPWIVLIALAFLAAAFILSSRVDINEFSMHHLYRNRLIRCYLGASTVVRRGQPFTGFDRADDLPLAALQIPEDSHDSKDARPFPILNAALNVVRGQELAVQSRKARAFAMTPLYCGFTRPVKISLAAEGAAASPPPLTAKALWQSFYALAGENGSAPEGEGGGLRLGTAMAISGAAASPNMGYHTSPALSFLMTLFDVRLGWWMGNPSMEEAWKSPGPVPGFRWLLDELFGSTTDVSDYIYLSDGGHFENLAIYELVRRRCRVIVVSDASQDGGFGFEDLHNAIERCRTDFGVEIKLDTQPLAQDAQRHAAGHFQVGTVEYTHGANAQTGIIVYLKPNLMPGDPADVLGYAARHLQFPHDPTANQWYDENQFESYRALGHAAGRAAAGEIFRVIQPHL